MKNSSLFFVFILFFVSCSNNNCDRNNLLSDIKISDDTIKKQLLKSPAVKALERDLQEKQNIFLISKRNTCRKNKIIEIPVSKYSENLIRENLYNALKNRYFSIYKVPSVKYQENCFSADISNMKRINEFITAKNSTIEFNEHKNSIFLIKIGKTSLVLNSIFGCDMKDSIFLIMTNYIIIEFNIKNIDNTLKFDMENLQ